MAYIEDAYSTTKKKTTTPTKTTTTTKPVTTVTTQPKNTQSGLSQDIINEIQRKAGLGIPLEQYTPEKQAIYDMYAKTTAPQATVQTPQTIAQQPSPQDYITQLSNAKIQAQISALDKSRNQSLSNLSAERANIQPYFYDQRNAVASQNAQNARNFAEFMAARGGTNSGANAQAELTRNMMYQGNLGSLGRQETQAYTDIERRTSDINNAYQSDVANAVAGNEANKLELLLNDYYLAQQRGDTLAQQAIQNEMAKAGLTGYYQGSPTQSMQSQQWNQTFQQQQLEQSAKQFAEQMGYNWATLSQRDKEYMINQAQSQQPSDQYFNDYQKQIDNIYKSYEIPSYATQEQKQELSKQRDSALIDYLQKLGNAGVSENTIRQLMAIYGLNEW